MDEWCSVWAKSLAGLDGDQIAHGLDYCGKSHEWPPTTAEFRSACLSLRKHVARIEHMPIRDKAEQSRKMHDVMAKIGEPKTKPVLHWRNVLETKGLPEISYRYAREALAIIDPHGEQVERAAA